VRRASRTGRYPQAFVPFFLAAALFGALSVPVWALQWSGVLAPPPGDPALRHGHEMLLGYALAVVGGFLFNKLTPRTLALAFALWLAARLAAGMAPGWPAAVLALGFPLAVLAFAALPFARAARTGHNLVFAPVLGAFVAAELLYQLGALGLLPAGERRGVMLALDLLLLLLLVMGGRIIPAATAGIVRAKGGFLPQRVQPALEWTGIAGLVLALILDTALAAPAVAGLASAVAGATALIRLARWKTAWTLDAPALWSLHLGYAWLGLGLILEGAAGAGLLLRPADAVHAVTVGALGTLTVAMMMRTMLQRRGLPVVFDAAATAAVVLVSAAAVLRLAGMTVAPAACWSLALLAAAAAMTRALRRGRPRFPSSLRGNKDGGGAPR